MNVRADAWTISVLDKRTRIVAPIANVGDWIITAEAKSLNIGGEGGAWRDNLEFSSTAHEVEDRVDTHVARSRRC